MTRFFSFHFTFPFIIAGLAAVHLVALHANGSSNPLGVNSRLEKLPLQPYFAMKDLAFMLPISAVLLFITLFMPNLFIHPDNYMMANPLVTRQVVW